MNLDDYVTVGEMAAMHNVAPQTIRMILWADRKREPADQVLPGAVKLGGERRGVWYIPRDVASRWQRDPRGRKPKA